MLYVFDDKMWLCTVYKVYTKRLRGCAFCEFFKMWSTLFCFLKQGKDWLKKVFFTNISLMGHTIYSNVGGGMKWVKGKGRWGSVLEWNNIVVCFLPELDICTVQCTASTKYYFQKSNNFKKLLWRTIHAVKKTNWCKKIHGNKFLGTKF